MATELVRCTMYVGSVELRKRGPVAMATVGLSGIAGAGRSGFPAEAECEVTVPAEPSHGTFEVPYVGEPLTVVLERP